MRRWWDTDLRGLEGYAIKRESPPRQTVRFSSTVRAAITRRFNSAWCKFNPGKAQDGEAEVFLGNLEWYAEKHLEDPGALGADRLSAQAELEKIEAVANALDGLVGALQKAPATACWMSLYLGMQEIGEKPSPLMHALFPQPLPLNYPFNVSPYGIPDLSTIATAFRAGKSKQATFRRSGSRYFEGVLAHEIVVSLQECNISPSTSSTGLAGYSFEAVCDLVGKEDVRAGYWLKKALVEKGQIEQERSIQISMCVRAVQLQLALLGAIEKT
ncbi:hypothetical protein EQ832_12825 [Pseudomonas sp. ALS1131]|nr:hypothetical protein [Pseudomonas sp. ALS1131]TRO37658.1 hypothetical protein EQ832_12825 [Pseudomonas sp. ALS1131]